MRALTYQGPYQVRVEDKPDPSIEHRRGDEQSPVAAILLAGGLTVRWLRR